MSVTLLTRVGCPACAQALDVLRPLCADLAVSLEVVDVDVIAAQQPDVRAEYGDRLPVVMLNGREHSYGDVDEARLRRDLAASA